MRSPIRIDATVLEKRKAESHLQGELALYKMGWSKKTRRLFSDAVDDVVKQVSPARHRVAFWAADSDPCIQVADYCCWAVQRAWEREDSTFLDLLGSKVVTNKDIWQSGETFYY